MVSDLTTARKVISAVNHTTRNESGDQPPCNTGLSLVKVTMASPAHLAVVLLADEVCRKMIMLMGTSMTLGVAVLDVAGDDVGHKDAFEYEGDLLW